MLADVEPRVWSPVLVGRSDQLSALDTALPEALSKLSVTSRGEAAATAHRLRIFDSFSPKDPQGP